MRTPEEMLKAYGLSYLLETKLIIVSGFLMTKKEAYFRKVKNEAYKK